MLVMVIMLILNWGSDALGSSDGNGDGDGLCGAGNDADVTEGWESRSGARIMLSRASYRTALLLITAVEPGWCRERLRTSQCEWSDHHTNGKVTLRNPFPPIISHLNLSKPILQPVKTQVCVGGRFGRIISWFRSPLLRKQGACVGWWWWWPAIPSPYAMTTTMMVNVGERNRLTIRLTIRRFPTIVNL